MFVCGCVEYRVGAALLKNAVQVLAISCVRYVTMQDGFAAARRQFALQIKHCRLALVNTHQMSRVVFENLPAEFRADGTSSSRHQDGTPANGALDRLQIDFDGVSSQQVLYVNIAKIADADSLGDYFAQSRHGAELCTHTLAYFRETSHLQRRGRRYCNQHLIDWIYADQLRNLIDGPQDRETFDFQAHLGSVIIDVPDGSVLAS